MQCVADICGVELSTLLNQSKYSVYGNGTAVVEGHGGIADYNSNTVTFVIKGGYLHVCGSELRIKRLERGFAVVVGNIASVGADNEKYVQNNR